MTDESNELKGHVRKHYEEREDLSGEHRLSDIGQLIFLVSFLIIWILDSFVFHFSTFLVQYVPHYVRGILACIILPFAGFLAFKAHNLVFDEVKESPAVISSGVFGYVRHPMYMGSILLYVGLIIPTLSLTSLGFFVIIVIFYDYIASYEEKLLEQNFGEDYVKYKSEVSKWIPWKKVFRRKKK